MSPQAVSCPPRLSLPLQARENTLQRPITSEFINTSVPFPQAAITTHNSPSPHPPFFSRPSSRTSTWPTRSKHLSPRLTLPRISTPAPSTQHHRTIPSWAHQQQASPSASDALRLLPPAAASQSTKRLAWIHPPLPAATASLNLHPHQAPPANSPSSSGCKSSIPSPTPTTSPAPPT